MVIKYLILYIKILDQILFAEMKATIETLKKNLPLRYIELNNVKEMELGALVMFYLSKQFFVAI